ncbi:hypothetical protein ES703_50861 [subsurface metagenome]
MLQFGTFELKTDLSIVSRSENPAIVGVVPTERKNVTSCRGRGRPFQLRRGSVQVEGDRAEPGELAFEQVFWFGAIRQGFFGAIVLAIDLAKRLKSRIRVKAPTSSERNTYGPRQQRGLGKKYTSAASSISDRE